ncbi:MAG TPA: hypothetical protein EYQ50_09690 [Verrucomicrobiales bacterium]|nr:hypothetical protein [Verrucomicrobiales bacterium]HIL71074.1 hypothetical protein [Verrucomicrobiota bacterium]
MRTMNLDEFAFFNRQLSAMLRDGIPLEGSLKQLCQSMRSGRIKSEIEKLEKDLSKGVPLTKAVESRDLPEFYIKMMQVGSRCNDLPKVLQLIADYYETMNSSWIRLKGVMVYPMILFGGAMILSVFLAIMIQQLLTAFQPLSSAAIDTFASLWIVPIVFSGLFFCLVMCLISRRLRGKLEWILPGFCEAGLARIAGAIECLLAGGANLGDAITLMADLEKKTPAGRELKRWNARITEGHAHIDQIALPGVVFPPLFTWLISSSKDDPESGFRKAAAIYRNRSTYRIDLMLYAVLPVGVIIVGMIILLELIPLFHQLGQVMDRI